MLIRQKKSWLIIILVLIVLSLLLLTINKQKVHEEYRTLIEKTLSLDLGISDHMLTYCTRKINQIKEPFTI